MVNIIRGPNNIPVTNRLDIVADIVVVTVAKVLLM